MQSNNKWRIFGIALAFICLICLVLGGIGYFYFANLPPSVMGDSGYYIRLTKIYYKGGFPSAPFELEEADKQTFEILDNYRGYAKDKNYVYLDGIPIPVADSTTFELLEDPYSRDKNHVYVSSSIHSNDPANFEIVYGYIMRDSQHIYWSDKIISDDPSNIEIIEDLGFYTYWRNSTNIFINGSPIEDANVDTFEPIADAYSHDDIYIFYGAEILPQADVTSFQFLESPYTKDNTYVFWKANIIPNADPTTFVVWLANFECSADAQTAFYQDQPIPNFDPSTIPADTQVIGCNNTEVILSQ